MVSMLHTSGVEIRLNFLTGHKISISVSVSLSVSLWGVRKTEITELLDHHENTFPHLKGRLTLLENSSKWNPLILKGIKSCSLHVFFLYSHFEFELKNNDTIFTESEIQTMRKLNNPTTATFTGLSYHN